MQRFCIIFLLLFSATTWAAEVMPPAPANHFNDYANVVSSAVTQQLNAKLDEFERQSSNQIVVAVFPKMQTDSSIEDYTTRIFTNWKVGQKDKNNGAILFVFIQDHKLRIATGYGLEGALPDATCKQIIDQEIAPAFKRGDYAAGLTAGINAMIAATRGEYKGTGRTHGDVVKKVGGAIGGLFPIAIIILIFLAQRSTIYSRRGRRSGWFWGPVFWGGGFGGGGWNSGGSWCSSGGGFSGGGGTFSGGGGVTGGGGAGGSW